MFALVDPCLLAPAGILVTEARCCGFLVSLWRCPCQAVQGAGPEDGSDPGDHGLEQGWAEGGRNPHVEK